MRQKNQHTFDREIDKPKNSLEKLVVFDKGYDRDLLARRWGESTQWVRTAFQYPYKYFAYDHIMDIAKLTGKDIAEVFFMCRRPANLVRDEADLDVVILASSLGL